MLQRPEVRPHLLKAEALAQAEPHLYEVAYTDHA
jgi:hypothetical protein